MEAEAESERFERSDAARFLWEPYQFLNMTEQQIKDGLENSRQVDDDVAKEFHISSKTAHSLFSKF